MQRWQGAALAWVLCAGCLDPMDSDKAGYSRFIQDAGYSVPSAYDDPLLNRKIDLNDGQSPPSVPLKTGFAAGQMIQYWDFGTSAAKRATSPAYGIADCSGPSPVQKAGYPLIFDNLPGDTDYCAFRTILWGCALPKLQGQVIDSLDAFNDAIEIGFISDPTGSVAQYWVNLPIVSANVGLAFMNSVKPASVGYYRGTSVFYHDMSSQEGAFTNNPMTGLQTNNVYELTKPGATSPARVIFSQPYFLQDGVTPNPSYSPSWIVVTLTMKAQQVPMGGDANAALDMLISTLTNANDLVTVGMNNSVTVKNTAAIATATVTTTRTDRAFYVKEQP